MVSSRTTSTTRISAPHAKHCITRTHRYTTKPISGASAGGLSRRRGKSIRGVAAAAHAPHRATRKIRCPNGDLPTH